MDKHEIARDADLPNEREQQTKLTPQEREEQQVLAQQRAPSEQHRGGPLPNQKK